MKLNVHSLWSVIAAVGIVALFRFIPHVPNFVPLTAIAIFGGARLKSRWMAVALVLAAMLLSDIAIGFHSTLAFVYVSLAISVVLGGMLREKAAPAGIFAATIAASLQFFVVTNLGVFLTQDLYPKTWEGLMACYTMALPFFRTSLLADVLYTALLFSLQAGLLRAARPLSFSQQRA